MLHFLFPRKRAPDDWTWVSSFFSRIFDIEFWHTEIRFWVQLYGQIVYGMFSKASGAIHYLILNISVTNWGISLLCIYCTRPASFQKFLESFIIVIIYQSQRSLVKVSQFSYITDGNETSRLMSNISNEIRKAH